jgi:general secretion pathway protein M
MSRFMQLLASRVAWLQAITILLLLLPLVGASLYVWGKHLRIQADLSDIEPRYARLLGMVEHQTELSSVALQAQQQLARVAYPASQDATQAGNDAQQRIRTLFADSRLNVISIQVLPPKEQGSFDHIPIDLRVEGDLTAMQNALAALANLTPLVVAEEVSIQTVGVVLPASNQRLAAQFGFAVWRVRP